MIHRQLTGMHVEPTLNGMIYREKHLQEFTVHGFIRSNTNWVIPKDLKILCFEYYRSEEAEKVITIGLPGIYRISMELNHANNSGAGHIFNMIVNGNNVATRMGSNYGGYGMVERVLDLKKFDTVKFNTNYHYGTDKLYSCFTIEKL